MHILGDAVGKKFDLGVVEVSVDAKDGGEGDVVVPLAFLSSDWVLGEM